MTKIIFFEGLPGSGKTTITRYLEEKYPFCKRIGEVINLKGTEIPLEKHSGKKWKYFVKSDINKLELSKSFKDKIILIDRGFLSTLSHGFVRKEKNTEKDFDFILREFQEKLNIREFEVYYIYLKNNSKISLFRSKHSKEDIWGKKENLEKTELFYDIYFLFRKNVFTVNSSNLSLDKCKNLCEKILLSIKNGFQ